MRVAFVNHSRIRLPTEGQALNSNSIGLWSYKVATELADRCEMTVYHQVHEPELHEECEGVAFRGIPIIRDERIRRWQARWDKLRAKVGLRGNPRRPHFAISDYRAYIGAVARDIESTGCDVVLISNYPQFVPEIRARNPRAKIHLHMQCDWLVQLDRELLEGYLQHCDLISGCSDHVIRGVMERFPDHASKCFTIYNGVNTEEFAPAHQDHPKASNRILFVARLSPEKGVHTLLRALEIVAESHPDVEATIVGGRGQVPYEFVVALDDDPLVQAMSVFYGDGPYTYERALHDMIPAAMKDRIRFVDHIPQPEVLALYQQATLFLFPSEWHEPFGMPIIEAMSCGVAVVTTDSGGIPEFVTDGETGLIVPRGDASALATAICTLLSDPDRRESMGTAGRAVVTRGFTWRHVAQALHERWTTAADR